MLCSLCWALSFPYKLQNKFLDINEFNGYVINCYDVYDIKEDVNEIIDKHDYYMNTTGVIKKEFGKEANKMEYITNPKERL